MQIGQLKPSYIDAFYIKQKDESYGAGNMLFKKSQDKFAVSIWKGKSAAPIAYIPYLRLDHGIYLRTFYFFFTILVNVFGYA